MVGNSKQEPLLEDFLMGKSLACNPTLRNALLCHCAKNSILSPSSWVRMLEHVACAEGCDDVVIQVVGELKGDAEICQWVAGTSTNKSMSLSLRLQLILQVFPRDIPKSLLDAAELDLMSGAQLPMEVMPLLDASRLFQQALQSDMAFVAAALVDHLPSKSSESHLQDDAQLLDFLNRGLIHRKRSTRRACIDVLRSRCGTSCSALLALLSEEQPLHLLEAVEVPPAALHDAAATMCLHYGDSRVMDAFFDRLTLSRNLLFGSCVDAALRYVGFAKPPAWIAKWQQKVCEDLRGKDFAAIEGLLSKPFQPGGCAPLLSEWQSSLTFVGPPFPSVEAMRSLRRLAPSVAVGASSKLLLSPCADAVPHEVLLEALFCDPPEAIINQIPEERLTSIAKACQRKDLPHLAEVVPDVVREVLLECDAGMALWGIGAFSTETIVRQGGFRLQFQEQDTFMVASELGIQSKWLRSSLPFAETTWANARSACMSDPALSSNYPICDPEYESFRLSLLTLGPLAASHTTLEDLGLLKEWSSRSEPDLTREEKCTWLRAVSKLLTKVAQHDDIDDSRSSDLASLARSTATRWALESQKDRGVVAASLQVLSAAMTDPIVLQEIWPALKSCGLVRNVASVFGTRRIPECLLDRVLASSSLASDLANLHLTCAEPQAPIVAALVVRASQATGVSSSSLAVHPLVQLCSTLSTLPAQFRNELFNQVVDVERGMLPQEGSPHGEAHHRHVRLWVCVGSIVDVDDTLAAKAGALVMQTLRAGGVLPGTRVVLQNVWARCARSSASVLTTLVETLNDSTLPEGFSTPCVAVAAQLLLHPAHGFTTDGRRPYLDNDEVLKPLLAALVAWSASYVHKPRLLASLALYHALDKQLLESPGWYLEALHCFVAHEPSFRKLRERVRMDTWVSDAWLSLSESLKCLDVAVTSAQKQISADFWSVPEDLPACTGEAYQRRPTGNVQMDSELDVALVGSLLDNVPNMAGLVRTAESLLGSRVEVALGSDKVLQDAHFLKMSVAAERSCRIVAVPEGPRLVAYLREKRAEGFQVVALEQTSASEVLDLQTKLPKRVVVIIGSEQQGVPSWIVQSGLIDRFLELPLLGQCRSLNAHVATSMLLWHYRLEH